MPNDHRRTWLVSRLVLQATSSLLCAGLLGLLGMSGLAVRLGYGPSADVPFMVAGGAGAVGGVLVAVGLLRAAVGVVRDPADSRSATRGLLLSRVGRWIVGAAATSAVVLGVVMGGLQDEDGELLVGAAIALALVLCALLAGAAKADAAHGSMARYLSRVAGQRRHV